MVKKIIGKEDIILIFNDLLSDNITREEASNIALNLRLKIENNEIEIYPSLNESKIWDCILFIEGVDLEYEPDKYLHNIEDIIDYKNNILNNII